MSIDGNRAEDALTAGPMFRILGPLQVTVGGRQDFTIPPGRQQIVLGVLLLGANRVVSIDHLIDAIWDDDPPATARTQVQICVSRLRNSLIAAGCEAIVTRPPGYLMPVRPGQLDAQLFTTLTADADTHARAGRADQAADVLGQAVGLWRGPALTGINSHILRARATELDERRLAAVESHVDLQLQLGRHHQLVGELSTLVSENPLRERLRGQLMLALYRSGRQAEALEAYRHGRELMIDQLGLEPSEELRRLETSILAGDVAPRTVEVAPVLSPRAAEPEVPFQLPTDIADFTGRAELVERTERLLADTQEGEGYATRVVVLAGKPGVGKSALAVHVAHRLGDNHFPDGQLYCDLGGNRTEPTRAVDVLGRFLRALGVPGEAVPEQADERAEMYRHLLARRRILVLLDDAAGEAQVRPLLPGSGTSVVVVTSRARLTGLAGARLCDVDVFDQDEALSMLASVIGAERVAAEPAAAEALIRLVGRLPLALRIVAARLGARPHWSLAWMLERLSDERRRLDELAHGELMVRASLALTYDGLAPRARRLLRLLSVLDGLSFPNWVAAALLDADYLDAADLLEVLVDAQMVEVAAMDITGSPRYKLHGLIRLFAREQLEQHEPDQSREAAVGRVAGGWLGLSDAAHRRIYGGDFTVLHGPAPRWHPPASYTDRVLVDPLAWLESEHANLCSTVTLTAASGLPEPCWDLAVSLVTLFEARCYFDDWEKTHRVALAAAAKHGNRRGVAAVRCSLGSLHLSRRQLAAAEEELLPALGEFEELGDSHGIAMALRNLALLDQIRGATGPAYERYTAALAGFRAVGDLVGQAHVLGQIAQLRLDRGEPAEAGAHLADALAICQEVGNRRVEVQIRYKLSELMLRDGRPAEAKDVLVDLLRVVREWGDIVGESRILRRLGQVTVRLGQADIGERLLAEALVACEQTMDRAGADAIRGELARLVTG
ncbi:AfsR/SARP family transcriptional regulator [Actinophytocola sp.]|uniref:AfsR/SARP family transcriptional regulator n=1 Tax=Actinophytocola sp. TaxID=1872138 RepID=UPI002EDA15D0